MSKLLDLNRAGAIASRKISSLRRDHRTIAFIVIMPALQILLFGLAIGGTPNGLDFAVIDDGSPMFNQITDGLNGSESLVIHLEVSDEVEARDMIQQGELWGALMVQKNGTLLLVLDNSNQQVSSTIIVEVRTAMTAALAAQGASLPLEIGDPVYGERDPAFIDFLAPGIMVMVCFLFSIILTTMAFVGERYDGTLDRVFATGTQPIEVLLGHLVAFSTILIGQVSVVILIAVYGFDIPLEGSLITLFMLALLLGGAAMCFGLFVSSKAKSEFQAMQVIMPVTFPVLLLSGILWPIEGIPLILQPVAWALPTSWSAEAFRSIMIRGWGFEHAIVWKAFLYNGAFAIAMLTLAAKSLKVRE